MKGVGVKKIFFSELDVAKLLRHCGALVAPQWSSVLAIIVRADIPRSPIQNVLCNILKIYVTKWYN
jgi:hypothetical protein